jgi:hypothetical protein
VEAVRADFHRLAGKAQTASELAAILADAKAKGGPDEALKKLQALIDTFLGKSANQG